jgi:hypothetical protein
VRKLGGRLTLQRLEGAKNLAFSIQPETIAGSVRDIWTENLVDVLAEISDEAGSEDNSFGFDLCTVRKCQSLVGVADCSCI